MDRHALLERLDPRVKFLSLVLIGYQTTSSHSSGVMYLVAVIVIAGCVLARVQIREIFRRAQKVVIFLAAIILFNLFTTSGDILFSLGELYATREGLATGLQLSYQLLVLALLAMLFVRTTPVVSVLDALNSGTRWSGRAIRSFVQMVTLALQFVPLLIHNARQIKRAHLAYGAETGGNIVRQVRFASAASVPLFVKAFRSASQLSLAMDSRCYNPNSTRTRFAERSLRRTDWFFLAGMLLQFALSQFLLS
jgi:energy-coupling factor transport system permease protein